MFGSNPNRWVIIGCLGVLTFSFGCRGFRSEKPPFHLNPNLDWQAKKGAQKDPRSIPEGVVAWGDETRFSNDEQPSPFREATRSIFSGKDQDGNWVKNVPILVDEAVLKRGQERYDIYCAICHDRAGSGKGTVISRGFLRPPELWDQRLMMVRDGELFNVISNGIRNMPGYAKQIEPEDRWAIVTYVRALQKAANGRLKDVPVKKRATIKQ